MAYNPQGETMAERYPDLLQLLPQHNDAVQLKSLCQRLYADACKLEADCSDYARSHGEECV